MQIPFTSHIHLHVRQVPIHWQVNTNKTKTSHKVLLANNTANISDDVKNVTALKNSLKDSCLFIALARSQKSNALSKDMLIKAKDLFESINKYPSIRAVIIYAEGANFCSGVDLSWFQDLSSLDEKKRYSETLIVQDFFAALAKIKVPVISCVHGICAGGGMGIIAASDCVIAHLDSKFMLAEVKLGLIPAVIMPYLSKLVSLSDLKRWAMSAKTINVKQALAKGLCHETFDLHPFESIKKELVSFLKADFNAQKTIKSIIIEHSDKSNNLDNIKKMTNYDGARILSDNLSSNYATQGLAKFLSKKNVVIEPVIKIPSSVKLPCPPFV